MKKYDAHVVNHSYHGWVRIQVGHCEQACVDPRAAAYLINLGAQAMLAKLDLHAEYESIDPLQVLRQAAEKGE